MKKVFLLLFACCMAQMAIATVRLKGTLDKEAGSMLMLMSVDNGIPVICKETYADAAGKFTLETAIPYTGFYMLVNELGVKHVLYLQDGDNLTIHFANDKMQMQGSTTAVGKTIAQWNVLKAPALVHAYLFSSIPGGETTDPETFNPEYKALQAKAKTLKTQLTGTNRELAALQIDADLAFLKLAYYKNHGGELDSLYVSDAELSSYDALFNQDKLLKLPHAGEMLWMYVNHKADQAHVGQEDYAQRAAWLSGTALQEAYLYQEAQKLRYYEKLALLQNAMGNQSPSATFMKALEPLKEKLAWSKPGQEATDFEGERPDGSRMKLSDLKGKLVVIDVWATWCAPCIRMMPLFKQLEEEIKDPRLAFMSVCLGVSVEIDRWKKLIDEHQLHGNLIFIDSWTKGFAKQYRVTGVPRFLIISPDGKAISYSAPAPTHPELKQMILSELAKLNK